MLPAQIADQIRLPDVRTSPDVPLGRPNRVRWGIDQLNLLLRGVVGLMLLTMVIVVFLQILVRFVLPKMGVIVSVPWTEELARYLLIWCIFLGAAAATRSSDLIAMDTLSFVLSPVNVCRLKLYAYGVTMVFFVFLMIIGVRWMGFGMTEYSTVMDIPMVFVYLAMPVGSALALMNITIRSLECWRRMQQERCNNPGLDQVA